MTGLEIRRRARTGRPAGFVLGVLISAVVLSLAAQVVEAEPSIVGWLAAALPALGFLACVKIVLARTITGPAEVAVGEPTDPAHVPPVAEPPAKAPGPLPRAVVPMPPDAFARLNGTPARTGVTR